MAEKLSVQIALDGGAEIERQLEGIGEAGTKAFNDIAKAAEQAGGFKQLDPKDVTAKLQEMGVTGADSINKIQAAVQSAGRLETLVQGVASVQTALSVLAVAAVPVGTAIATAFVGAAKAAIAFAGEVNKINDQAIKLGAPVAQVDKFRAGLEQAGVSAKSVGEILQSKLASQQGVEGLQRFIQQLERMPDSAGRSALAVKEFGAAGVELIRILQAGGQLTGFGPPGGLINAEDAKKATQLGVALNQLESSVNRLNTISLAPALTTGINVATAAVQALGQRLEQTPWSTFFNAANLGLNPVASLISTIVRAFTPLAPAIEKSGQAAQAAGVMFTQWGTVANQAGQQAAEGGRLATVGFTSYGTVVEGATNATRTFGQSVAGIVWDSISSVGVAAWNLLTSAIQSAYEWLLKFVRLSPSAPATGGGGGSGPPTKASGGLLGGRGTGTSDSNLAWVSRGEHIMPARAVSQPGVLAFLEALRRSGGDLSRVLNGMGRFALGGMVPRMPTFAAGGLAGGSNVTIQFPGLPAIAGLRASSDVVDQLHRAAALAQVRSGGRKPSRYS